MENKNFIDRSLVGIEGWLIFWAIGTIATLLSFVVELTKSYWTGTIFIVIMLAWELYMAYIFFAQKKIFKVLVFWSLSINAVLGIIGELSQRETLEDKLGALAGIILATCIWFLYFKKSKRVQNTFIND